MSIQIGGIIKMKRDGCDVTKGVSYVITDVESDNTIAFKDDVGDEHYWPYPSEDYEIVNPGSNEWEKEVGKLPLVVGFKRLTGGASIPSKAHASDSGFDLVASADVIVEPGETVVVPTGIAVQLPPGYEAQVRPRSGVTSKTKLRVQLGTIDEGYGGEIGVIVDNVYRGGRNPRPYYYTTDGKAHKVGSIKGFHEEGSQLIRKGDRIAQLVVQPLPIVEAVEVEDVDETERSEGGFGSTGV